MIGKLGQRHREGISVRVRGPISQLKESLHLCCMHDFLHDRPVDFFRECFSGRSDSTIEDENPLLSTLNAGVLREANP